MIGLTKSPCQASFPLAAQKFCMHQGCSFCQPTQQLKSWKPGYLREANVLCILNLSSAVAASSPFWFKCFGSVCLNLANMNSTHYYHWLHCASLIWGLPEAKFWWKQGHAFYMNSLCMFLGRWKKWFEEQVNNAYRIQAGSPQNWWRMAAGRSLWFFDLFYPHWRRNLVPKVLWKPVRTWCNLLLNSYTWRLWSVKGHCWHLLFLLSYSLISARTFLFMAL